MTIPLQKNEACKLLDDPARCNFKRGWLKIGEVGVDGGSLMVIDPAYVHGEWNNIDRQREKIDTMFKQLKYSAGHDGVAVTFNSGFGDGTYDVLAKIVKDPKWGMRVAAVRVDMIGW
jgi:hypothetical protein